MLQSFLSFADVASDGPEENYNILDHTLYSVSWDHYPLLHDREGLHRCYEMLREADSHLISESGTLAHASAMLPEHRILASIDASSSVRRHYDLITNSAF